MRRSARWRRLLPGVDSLSRYERAWLRGDVLAGITVAAYLVPQVMAYAEVAGLPAVVGLWAVLVSLLVYAVFGSSRQLSVGPESTTALLTRPPWSRRWRPATRPGTRRSPPRSPSSSARCACWPGCSGWVSLADLLSKPVLVGYLAGVGGADDRQPAGQDRPAYRSRATPSSPSWSRSCAGSTRSTVPPCCCRRRCSCCCSPERTASRARRCRSIVMVARARWSTAVLDLQDGRHPGGRRGADRAAATGLPDVSAADLAALLLPAVGVTVVAYTDNVLTGTGVRASATATASTPTRNCSRSARPTSATGFAQAFPVSSSGSRTVIGDAVGSRSQLYSLVAVVLVVRRRCSSAGPLLASFPVAALGALVIYAAHPAHRHRGSSDGSPGSGAASSCSPSPPPSPSSPSTSSTGCSSRSACRSSTCCAGSPARTTASSATCPGVAGMHDVDDYPRRPTGSRPGRLPLRRPAVLRQRRGLPPPRARRGRRRPDADAEWFILNAEANVEIDMHGRRTPSRQLRAELGRRGIVFAHGPGQAGPPQRACRRRAGRADRRGADLPDPADRGGGLRRRLHRSPRDPARRLAVRRAGPAVPELTGPGSFGPRRPRNPPAPRCTTAERGRKLTIHQHESCCEPPDRAALAIMITGWMREHLYLYSREL